MSARVSLLQELENAVSKGSADERETALSHVTNLLKAGQYSDDQIWLFGEIIEKLTLELTLAARSRFSSTLASLPNAPVKTIQALAFDDSIKVAGPVLRHSERLDAKTLVAIARSKGQQHLFAISQRKSLSPDVTDVLVSRGNREVLNLLKRSESDSILVESLGSRRDIPRHIFQQLIAKASEAAKQKLQTERPELAGQMNALVADVTDDLQSKFGPSSKDYFAAKRLVQSKHQNGALTQATVFEYATSRKLDETIIALSLLSSLPANLIERAINDPSGETTLILAKALNFSWGTAMALLFLGARDHKISASRLDKLGRDFSVLDSKAAKRVLQTYKLTKGNSDSNWLRRLPQLHT